MNNSLSTKRATHWTLNTEFLTLNSYTDKHNATADCKISDEARDFTDETMGR